MRYAAAILIVFGASGCADIGQSPPASIDTSTAVYSPPIRPDGRGSVIILPPSNSLKSAKRPPALEAADRSPRPPTVEWLQGTWLMNAKRDDLSRVRCNSGTTDTYNPDGTTENFDYRGQWKLDGGKLTETITEVFEGGNLEGDFEIGKPWAVQIRRLGPNEGAIRSDKGWEPMLRCRPGDMTK